MPNSNLTFYVAAEIRAEMARQSIVVRDLAEKTAITPRVLARAIKGERSIQVDELERIASALGVSIAHLLNEAQRNAA